MDRVATKNDRRVLLISHEMSVTGAPNSLLRQAKYFLSAGYVVDVWTLQGGELEARYREIGLLPHMVRDSRRDIKAAYEKRPYDYELIICNTISTSRVVDVLWHLGAKVAWFIRETKLLDEACWLDGEFAVLFRSFGNLYTVSPYAADVVRRYNPNVRVICNSVADVFVRQGASAGRVRFGFIGSLIPVKGVDLLVQAFCRMRARFPGCELRIAGKTSVGIGEELRRLTAGDPSVIWLGEVQGESKRSFFDSIDVLCVPSLDEPSGLTVLEGTMYGKAVVTTDRTGANYAVDSSCGRIVSAGDVASLEVALAELASLGPVAVSKMGECARERYLRCGSPEAEREAVLKMVDDARALPPATGRLRLAKHPLFRVKRYLDGRRLYYFWKIRLLTFRGRPYPGH